MNIFKWFSRKNKDTETPVIIREPGSVVIERRERRKQLRDDFKLVTHTERWKRAIACAYIGKNIQFHQSGNTDEYVYPIDNYVCQNELIEYILIENGHRVFDSEDGEFIDLSNTVWLNKKDFDVATIASEVVAIYNDMAIKYPYQVPDIEPHISFVQYPFTPDAFYRAKVEITNRYLQGEITMDTAVNGFEALRNGSKEDKERAIYELHFGEIKDDGSQDDNA